MLPSGLFVTAIVKNNWVPKYIVDPVRLGWRATQTITRVFFHFIDTARHKAHLRTKCKCKTCGGKCAEARKLLAKSCVVCKRLKKWDQSECELEQPDRKDGRLTMLSMAETLNLVHKHGFDQALITRLQAKRSKENAKVVREKIFGQRSE